MAFTGSFGSGSSGALNKLDGTVPPTASNDVSEGYTPQSQWFDVVGKEIYVCLSNALGAAVWLNSTLTLSDLGALAIGNDAGDVPRGLSNVDTDLTALESAVSGKLAISSNLSDLQSASTARTNLGLGTLATQSGTFSGTSSGTNTGDQDLSGLLVKASNLSDLADASTARTNLGVYGTASVYTKAETEAAFVDVSTTQTIAGNKSFSADTYVGAPADVFAPDDQANFTNIGANLTWSSSGIGSFSNNYISMTSDLAVGKTATGTGWQGNIAEMTDGDLTPLIYADTYPATVVIDMASPTAVNNFGYYLWNDGENRQPSSIQILGSDNGTDYTSIQTLTSALSSTQSTGAYYYDFTNTTAYRYYKFIILQSTVPTPGFFAVQQWYLRFQGYAITSNSFDTNFTYAGSKVFAPASFAVYDSTNVSISSDSAVSIAYTTDGGSTYSSYYSLSAFRALANITASANQFQIRLKPVGTQTISKAYIETSSSQVHLEPSGDVSTEVDAVVTHRLSNKLNTTDLNAALASQTRVTYARNYLQTTDANFNTIATIPLTDDSAYFIEVNLIGNASDSANRAAYKLTALAYRANAGSATIQNGNRLCEFESSVAWDAQITTSGNDIIVQAKGAAGVTVKWQSTLKYESVAETLSA